MEYTASHGTPVIRDRGLRAGLAAPAAQAPLPATPTTCCCIVRAAGGGEACEAPVHVPPEPAAASTPRLPPMCPFSQNSACDKVQGGGEGSLSRRTDCLRESSRRAAKKKNFKTFPAPRFPPPQTSPQASRVPFILSYRLPHDANELLRSGSGGEGIASLSGGVQKKKKHFRTRLRGSPLASVASTPHPQSLTTLWPPPARHTHPHTHTPPPRPRALTSSLTSPSPSRSASSIISASSSSVIASPSSLATRFRFLKLILPVSSSSKSLGVLVGAAGRGRVWGWGRGVGRERVR